MEQNGPHLVYPFNHRCSTPLGCFHLLDTVNNDAMNLLVQISILELIFQKKHFCVLIRYAAHCPYILGCAWATDLPGLPQARTWAFTFPALHTVSQVHRNTEAITVSSGLPLCKQLIILSFHWDRKGPWCLWLILRNSQLQASAELQDFKDEILGFLWWSRGWGAPDAGDPGSLPGQGTRCHVLQLKRSRKEDRRPTCHNRDPAQLNK